MRGSLIVAAVIPLAVLTAFIGLSLCGLPANLISLGAGSQDLGLGSAGTIILTLLIAIVGLAQLKILSFGSKEERA